MLLSIEVCYFAEDTDAGTEAWCFGSEIELNAHMAGLVKQATGKLPRLADAQEAFLDAKDDGDFDPIDSYRWGSETIKVSLWSVIKTTWKAWRERRFWKRQNRQYT